MNLVDLARETRHMTPEDVELHCQIIRAKHEWIKVRDDHADITHRAAARGVVAELRRVQDRRFRTQQESGWSLAMIGQYWNRTPQFVRWAILRVEREAS